MKKISGFSTIELIVSIAITAILFSIVIWNYRSFGDRLNVEKDTEEAILFLRQAQVNASAVKESGQGTGDFSGWYGVYFDSGQDSLVPFRDVNKNLAYDTGENILTYKTNGSIELFEMDGSGSLGDSSSNLTIVFQKSLYPTIFDESEGELSGGAIKIYSSGGSENRLLCVFSNGRLFISKNTACN